MTKTLIVKLWSEEKFSVDVAKVFNKLLVNGE